MTAAPADQPNAQPGVSARPRQSDPRFRFGRSLIAVEIAVTAAEIVLVVGPALALAAQSLARAARSPLIAGAHYRQIYEQRKAEAEIFADNELATADGF